MVDRGRDKQKLRRWCISRLLEDWPIRRSQTTQGYRRVRFTIGAVASRGKDGRGWSTPPDEPAQSTAIPEATIRRVVQIRQQEGWCHEAIAAYLNQKENIKVSSGSVYLILKRNGLITKPYKPRRQRTYIRFARQHPDSLWQTDIKYYGDRYLIAYLDDCSWYIPAASIYREAATENVLETLELVVRDVIDSRKRLVRECVPSKT